MDLIGLTVRFDLGKGDRMRHDLPLVPLSPSGRGRQNNRIVAVSNGIWTCCSKALALVMMMMMMMLSYYPFLLSAKGI